MNSNNNQSYPGVAAFSLLLQQHQKQQQQLPHHHANNNKRSAVPSQPVTAQTAAPSYPAYTSNMVHGQQTMPAVGYHAGYFPYAMQHPIMMPSQSVPTSYNHNTHGNYYQQQSLYHTTTSQQQHHPFMAGVMNTTMFGHPANSANVSSSTSTPKAMGGLLSTLPLAKPANSRFHGNHSHSHSHSHNHSQSQTNMTHPWQYPAYQVNNHFASTPIAAPSLSHNPSFASPSQTSNPSMMLQQQQQHQTYQQRTASEATSSNNNSTEPLFSSASATVPMQDGISSHPSSSHPYPKHQKHLGNSQQKKKIFQGNQRHNKFSSSHGQQDHQHTAIEIDRSAGPYQEFNVEGQRFNILVSNDQSEIENWIKQRQSRFPTKQRVEIKTERNELQNLCGGSNSTIYTNAIESSSSMQLGTQASPNVGQTDSNVIASTSTEVNREGGTTQNDKLSYRQKNAQKNKNKRKFDRQGNGNDDTGDATESKNKQQPRKQQRKGLVDVSVGLFDRLTKSTKDEEENIILQCIHFIRHELLVNADDVVKESIPE